ncbi:MAG: type II secretion system F family protein [Betaproteobacteria bacterium]|nr:type II secretion system F family protein [Betaproteobacteria bacterium]
MPLFRYEGFDQSGGRVSGALDADSNAAAMRELRARGILPSSLAEAGADKDWRSALGLESDKVSLADLEFLTAELSLLLDSGVRIDRAIGILQRAGKGGAMSRLLNALSADLKSGRQLSEAAAAHPEVFDKLYVNLVALGEAGGRLPEVFRGLAEDLRFQRELRQKVLSAATYPFVVAGVCVLALLFIFNFVVPNLESLFADATELPWYTAALLGASEFMRDWQWLVGIAIAGAGYLVWRFRKSSAVVDFFDRLLLDTPGLRDALSMVERIRFSSGLGLMLDADLPVDRALTLATGNIRHGTLRREMTAAVEKVKRGEQLSKVLRQTRLFPDYYASLLEVGEEGGELAKVFTEIARRSRDSFSAWALRLTTLLEPLLILIMGLIVGGVVVIMMLSITSVTEVGL